MTNSFLALADRPPPEDYGANAAAQVQRYYDAQRAKRASMQVRARTSTRRVCVTYWRRDFLL